MIFGVNSRKGAAVQNCLAWEILDCVYDDILVPQARECANARGWPLTQRFVSLSSPPSTEFGPPTIDHHRKSR